MKIKELWKPKDLAETLGVTEETLLGWRSLGMPWAKLGREIYIVESSFLQWVKNSEKSRLPESDSQ